ncbi:MAG TPA: outer membrane beta-barrel protein [Cyclobacteriaceae bacterium]|nr:outer membrane beta-barrel protein [Cyclobacteriaceae bacterium]
MQNSESQKFEDNWKSAFDGAEMTPPDKVWNSIELDLAGQESATMKKRVVFYQRLAAATVLFALLTGIYAFYIKTDNKQLAVKKNVQGNEVKSEAPGSVTNKEASSSVTTKETASPESHKPQKEVINQSNNVGQQAPFVPEVLSKEDLPQGALPIIALTEIPKEEAPHEALSPKEEETKKEEVTSPILQTAPLVASLEPQEETEKTEKKKNSGGNTWLALGAAAGNYSPNSGASSNPQAQSQSKSFGAPTYANLDAASTTDNKTKVGTSYSVGMAVGKKFGRFVVQSGFNFNKQQVDYTSSYDSRTTMNIAKASVSDYTTSQAENVSLTPTAAYTVNSSMEILSIPILAGYMIIDRKLGWQMNAGVSSDFFLRNTLVDKTGQRERFTQTAGDASPYRSVNWSGLVNTEVSYKVGDHYRVSFVPGVRYSFNPLLKDPGNSGKPIILDVGFRFKYLFD